MTRAFTIGVFDDEAKFVSAIRATRDQDLTIYDVFSPYPVNEVLHLLKRKSKLPTAAYFLGLFGIVGTLAFLYYTSVIDWPLVYGGKPFNSFPSFIVITLVVTIFIVTIGSLAIFSARSKMFPGRDNTIFDFRATDDKFVVVLTGLEDAGAITKAENMLKEHGAIEVINKEFENVKA
jgi:hypothetical protein